MRFVIVTFGATDGPWKVYAEVAEDEARGLSRRPVVLGGMLFPFDPPSRTAFWMKDTWVDLDIVWISPEMRVLGVTRMAAMTLDRHEPPAPVAYALELPAGDGRFVHVGDTVRIEVPR